MKRNKVMKAVALTMGAAMSMGVLASFAGCVNTAKKEALVIMTEELNELFNPFYSTAGSDMGVVGETQLSMFTTNSQGQIAYGENEACVVLDWKKETRGTGDDAQTDYYFVLKNGIRYSDGVPLTMNDVLFNMYVYLDPAYAGSSTMYSTDIVGLQAYRTQRSTSGDGTAEDESINREASTMATNRMRELSDLYKEVGETSTPGNYSANETKMRNAIDAKSSFTPGYLSALGLSADKVAEARAQLRDDYDNAVKKFREELKNDYKGAKDAYTDPTTPYPTAPIYYNNKQVGTGFDEIISFMYREGFVEIKYPQVAGSTPDRSKIERVDLSYDYERINTEEKAIELVYNSMISSKFDQILSYWSTGTQLRTEFVSKAKDVILHRDLPDGQLRYKNIEGIKSLGHSTDVNTLEINGKTYTIAHNHNTDGTPTNSAENDVLRITINGIDPKAQWNFGFSVAPHHYYAYSKDNTYPVDIANDQFGVSWANFDFQTKVLQGDNEWGASKNKVPLGAGAYQATDRNDTDKPGTNDFVSNNVVYYKRNEHFLLGPAKIEHMQYRVTSSSNAIGALRSGEVDFVTPQFTKQNGEIVKSTDFTGKGFSSCSTWQLGYGYIGINAGFIKNINLRRAIMAAMDTSLALDYYADGTVANIRWPMSVVSWAYPRTAAGADANDVLKNMKENNGHDYAGNVAGATVEARDPERIRMIKYYMQQAKVSAGDPDIKDIKFTIAGSSMTEHPAYRVFLHAVDLLNQCGWEVEVQADTNALTKLATGSLAVWAAAWGSTIDPDMYQVYHKNSTATSTLAWGYDDILGDTSTYSEEYNIILKLSDLIDQGRRTDNQATRTGIYEEAMRCVLDLAVELPVYQRQTLYAYNLNVIKESSLQHDENGKLINNPYSSPLSRLWEVEFAD